MVSFKKVQEMLCLCLIEEIIDEEEFVLLHEAYRPMHSKFLFLSWRTKSCIELAVRGGSTVRENFLRSHHTLRTDFSNRETHVAQSMEFIQIANISAGE